MRNNTKWIVTTGSESTESTKKIMHSGKSVSPSVNARCQMPDPFGERFILVLLTD